VDHAHFTRKMNDSPNPPDDLDALQKSFNDRRKVRLRMTDEEIQESRLSMTALEAIFSDFEITDEDRAFASRLEERRIHEAILDKIDQWHESDSKISLIEFLGWTLEEYKDYVEQNILPKRETNE